MCDRTSPINRIWKLCALQLTNETFYRVVNQGKWEKYLLSKTNTDLWQWARLFVPAHPRLFFSLWGEISSNPLPYPLAYISSLAQSPGHISPHSRIEPFFWLCYLPNCQRVVKVVFLILPAGPMGGLQITI